MDLLIASAAAALASGDPLAALNQVALRSDAPALALRGIAMAQLGDLVRAKVLLRSATRRFGPEEAVARARCLVAEAEIALATRDLGRPLGILDSASATLEEHGDMANAAYARLLQARRFLLIGQVNEAERALARIDPGVFSPAARTAHELLIAGIAIRRLHTKTARAALDCAAQAAGRAAIPALSAEVESVRLILSTPAARLITPQGEQRLLRLEEVEALLASKALVIDACRYAVHSSDTVVSLERRPVLFALARLLAEAWPSEFSREALIAGAFRTKHVDESHRARLRVEIGRLRSALGTLADVQATQRGFVLIPRHERQIAVLARPNEEKHAAVLALLADGEPWASSALAIALGTSQRSVQRALESLQQAEKAQSFGRGRLRRWITPPIPGFATSLLLSLPLPTR